MWAALWLLLCFGVPRERGAATMGGLMLIPTSQGKVQATIKGQATRYGWPTFAIEERWVDVLTQRVTQDGRLEPLDATPALVKEITSRGSVRVTTSQGKAYGSDDPRWQISAQLALANLGAALLLALLSWRLFARRARERWLALEALWASFLVANLAYPLWQALGSPASPLALASPEVALLGTAGLIGGALALLRRALDRPKQE
ncbi:MAG TPA: hypothetical protein DEA08_20125 [Planctomycetes bacterium]|nr:hypothetical protein [Planctomycetota bacterium]